MAYPDKEQKIYTDAQSELDPFSQGILGIPFDHNRFPRFEEKDFREVDEVPWKQRKRMYLDLDPGARVLTNGSVRMSNGTIHRPDGTSLILFEKELGSASGPAFPVEDSPSRMIIFSTKPQEPTDLSLPVFRLNPTEGYARSKNDKY